MSENIFDSSEQSFQLGRPATNTPAPAAGIPDVSDVITTVLAPVRAPAVPASPTAPVEQPVEAPAQGAAATSAKADEVVDEAEEVQYPPELRRAELTRLAGLMQEFPELATGFAEKLSAARAQRAVFHAAYIVPRQQDAVVDEANASVMAEPEDASDAGGQAEAVEQEVAPQPERLVVADDSHDDPFERPVEVDAGPSHFDTIPATMAPVAEVQPEPEPDMAAEVEADGPVETPTSADDMEAMLRASKEKSRNNVGKVIREAGESHSKSQSFTFEGPGASTKIPAPLIEALRLKLDEIVGVKGWSNEHISQNRLLSAFLFSLLDVDTNKYTPDAKTQEVVDFFKLFDPAMRLLGEINSRTEQILREAGHSRIMQAQAAETLTVLEYDAAFLVAASTASLDMRGVTPDTVNVTIHASEKVRENARRFVQNKVKLLKRGENRTGGPLPTA